MFIMQNMHYIYIFIGVIIIFSERKLEGIWNMDGQKKSDFYLHNIMCFIGGFIGAYAILNRGGNFGSAQTSNLIYLVFSILGRNKNEFLIRIFGMFLYFIGIELCVFLKHKTKINLLRYSILINMIGFLLLILIPASIDPIIGLFPIFFMMSTQWSVFHGAYGYNSSTIFSTNNFRQAALAIGEYLCDKDKAQLDKAKFFTSSLVWYHLGVAISFVSSKALGLYACLLCFIPCLVALFITYKDTKFESIFSRRKTMA